MQMFGDKIRLAYYDSFDGPRVVFFGPMDVDFRNLQEIFKRLSLNEGPFELHNVPFIQAFGGLRIVASSAGSMFDRGKGKSQGFRQLTLRHGKEFEWKRTAEGWDYMANKIDGLISSSGPVHQYLTSYPEEDAIVVVSKGEYGDEVLL